MDEELIGPICIITANGIICMESEPLRLQRTGKGIGLTKKQREKAEIPTAVQAVMDALPKNLRRVSDDNRRAIGRIAVYLAEAAQLLNKSGTPFSFDEMCWTIVKRPRTPKRA